MDLLNLLGTLHKLICIKLHLRRKREQDQAYERARDRDRERMVKASDKRVVSIAVIIS